MKPIFERIEYNEELVEYRVNGVTVMCVNHDQHGWEGMDAANQMFTRIEEVLNDA